MKQKRKVHYISIAEERVLYCEPVSPPEMILKRNACIQYFVDRKNFCRLYNGISEASILRLAKIQEKLANGN